jgi:hypothetical protein
MRKGKERDRGYQCETNQDNGICKEKKHSKQLRSIINHDDLSCRNRRCGGVTARVDPHSSPLFFSEIT